jgi:hypothetical protein
MRVLVLALLTFGAGFSAYAGELEIPSKDTGSLYRTWVEVREIDPENDSQELLIVEYSGGAHCCSDLTVVTKTPQGWKSLDLRLGIDGDNFFSDKDGDGVPELIADKVYQVRGGEIITKPCSEWGEWNGNKYCVK